MYNRYIPKTDGSFQKHAVPEPAHTRTPIPTPPQPPPPPDPPSVSIHKPTQDGTGLGFLRNLLPKQFDTGDLIIVLLLLLIAGDCEENQNSALLTLALYFFM